MLFKSFNRECWLIKYTPTAGKDEKFSQLSKRGNTQIHKYRGENIQIQNEQEQQEEVAINGTDAPEKY